MSRCPEPARLFVVPSKKEIMVEILAKIRRKVAQDKWLVTPANFPQKEIIRTKMFYNYDLTGFPSEEADGVEEKLSLTVRRTSDYGCLDSGLAG